jgi:hypothetical protein
MHHLGMSLKGLGSILGILGIANSVGNKTKWRKVQDIVGTACKEVSEEVMTENIEREIKLTQQSSKNSQSAYIEPAIVNEEEIEVAEEEMVVDNKKQEYEIRKNKEHKQGRTYCFHG